MSLTLDDRQIERGEYSAVCNKCKNYKSGYKCRAFEEIPNEIWQGKNDHRLPFEGDNGILFSPKKKKRQGRRGEYDL
jgi:hypothetical protein